ncbi:MAG: IS66 family transposase, partial [Gammaproteobacteria bacterium]
ALQEVEQSKCLGHLLRNVSEVVDAKQGPAKRFGTVLKEVLVQGHQLWQDYKEGKVAELTAPAQQVGERLKKHLRHRRLRDPDNQRLLDGIGLQNDRGRVFRFLVKPEVEPTNNRAERILRPAVIARKVSHCSKTKRGAHAHAAFQSVLQTAKKVGTSFSQSILQLTGLQ